MGRLTKSIPKRGKAISHAPGIPRIFHSSTPVAVNLSRDPGESKNIVSEHPERARKLTDTIGRLQAGTVFDVKQSGDVKDKRTRALLKSPWVLEVRE